MTGMSGPDAFGDETPRPFSPRMPPGNAPQGAASPASVGGVYPNQPVAPSAAQPAAPTRPGRVVHARGPRGGRRRDDGDAKSRFQGLVTAIGLAIGLLLVAGGGLLNATAVLPGLDATPTSGVPRAGPSRTPNVIATTTAAAQLSPTIAATATHQTSATPVPAQLTIAPPSVSNATCAAASTLVTLTLTNAGAVSSQWSATVSAPAGDAVTLSSTSGQLTGGGQDAISVNNTGANAITGATIQVTFTTTPAAAAPASPVTINCAA